jgi:hypothetical protein
MSFASYLDTPDGIAKVRDIVRTDPVQNGIARSVVELKAKWSSIGNIPHGQMDTILVNTPGFDPAVILPVTYSQITNHWYSQPELVMEFMLATGRATAAAAAIGTQVQASNEQYSYTNFQSYLYAGLTCQMEMYSTAGSNTATAFPIARFRAVKSTTNPVNVATPTPANVLALNHVTGNLVSSGIVGYADVSITGTGSHLWTQSTFEVGGAAALITGYYMKVNLRWKV